MLKFVALALLLLWLTGLSILTYRLWTEPAARGQQWVHERQKLLCEDALLRRRSAQSSLNTPRSNLGGVPYWQVALNQQEEANEDIARYCGAGR